MIKEGGDSKLNIPQTFCKIHTDKEVLSVCLHSECEFKGMFCYQCFKQHISHLDKTIEIKEYLTTLNSNINELQFNTLPNCPSPIINDSFRIKFDYIKEHKEDLLKQKVLLIDSISKYIDLVIDNATKQVEILENKTIVKTETQLTQELCDNKQKFLNIQNLQNDQIYELFVYFSRFIQKEDEQIKFVNQFPQNGGCISQSQSQEIEKDIESMTQTLINSKHFLQNFTGILDNLLPDDQGSHQKLTYLKMAPKQTPQRIGQTQSYHKQSNGKSSYHKSGRYNNSESKKQIKKRTYVYNYNEDKFNHHRNNFNGNNGFGQQYNNNYFEQQNIQNNNQQNYSKTKQNNGNYGQYLNNKIQNKSTYDQQPNNYSNKKFNASIDKNQIKHSLSVNKENREISNNYQNNDEYQLYHSNKQDVSQELDFKQNQNVNYKPSVLKFAPNMSNTQSAQKFKDENKAENKQKIQIIDDIEVPEQNFQYQQNQVSYQQQEQSFINKNSCNKNFSNQHIKLQQKSQKSIRNDMLSKKRLELRSFEHFCDALQVDFNDTWFIQFRSQKDCFLSGLYHLPIFVYDSSIETSLESAHLELLIYEENETQYKQIHSQSIILKKTNKQISSDETNLMNILEKIQINIPLKLKKNNEYVILLNNKTKEQDESSRQLYILYGDDQYVDQNEEQEGYNYIKFIKQNTSNLSKILEGYKLITENNDSLDDPQQTDYFIPYLAILQSNTEKTHIQSNTNISSNTSNIEQEDEQLTSDEYEIQLQKSQKYIQHSSTQNQRVQKEFINNNKSGVLFENNFVSQVVNHNEYNEGIENVNRKHQRNSFANQKRKYQSNAHHQTQYNSQNNSYSNSQYNSYNNSSKNNYMYQRSISPNSQYDKGSVIPGHRLQKKQKK